MDITQEQLDQIALVAAALQNNQRSDEPEWISDVRKAVSEGSAKTKEEAKKEFLEELMPYLKPLVKRGAMDTFLSGLKDDEADVTRELLKERYEKSPESVFSAAQDELTVRAVQALAREEAAKKRDADEASKNAAANKAPVNEELDDQAAMTKKAEDLKRYLNAAGVTKTDEEIANISAKQVTV